MPSYKPDGLTKQALEQRKRAIKAELKATSERAQMLQQKINSSEPTSLDAAFLNAPITPSQLKGMQDRRPTNMAKIELKKRRYQGQTLKEIVNKTLED